ncbi:glycoside hydrolase family 9 protein [Saccharicrinis fermentans]|uniref:Endoglucanase D n=1 Tax=Saccharicrinis fermentans DSM 9555 = JCM 21142 TaxID=869213 RepID=W7Y3X5_9BACT|nr:glycoside hydrolase family 9 protein [Saccharicrinis fermentans]GAF02288.1 endoglucanase D precursor [Saccharicrinis fermentans DSM 9555 = JCM 21142]
MKYLMAIFIFAALYSCQVKKDSKNKVSTGNDPGATLKYIHPASENIRLNQLGYFPKALKIATIVVNKEITTFSIIDLKTGEEVLNGKAEDKKEAQLSGETIQQLDFSALNKVGHYQIKCDNEIYSYPFKIGNDIYDKVLQSVAKSYYYQRVGTAITEEYGGLWKRKAGHPDHQVLFHPSTGKNGAIASAKGWYDAGDFGKYVTNGSFAAGQLLYTLEEYPDLYPDNSLNIPESGNDINDLLDEIKYEADWIATMQDRDGGVFHKLTTKSFADAIMPHEATEPRFIMPKSSVATFDFAAFMAKMARNYQKYDANLAKTWITQAQNAWHWGVQNPDVIFKNPSDVVTGEYGDDDSSQEQFWAASELYISTGKKQYLDFIQNNLPDLTYTYGDGWKSFMRYLGVFTLLSEKSDIPVRTLKELEKRLIVSADDLTKRIQTYDYQQGVNDFQWASNSDVQNIAFIIANAYSISDKQEYADAVYSSLNYLFGHNALGISMVTGVGSKSPMNIHHRASKSDSIKAPVPGFVCGGPNYGRQDSNDVEYPKNVSPMQAYRDVWKSYASNEVCLNWNSPTPYLLQFAIDNNRMH